MIVRIILFTLLVLWFASCGPRKEYIERNGLHSNQKPNEMAKEMSKLNKEKAKAYPRMRKKAKKEIKRRNRKKLKGNYFE